MHAIKKYIHVKYLTFKLCTFVYKSCLQLLLLTLLTFFLDVHLNITALYSKKQA